MFNTWTEIRSLWEGDFLERFAPGAFKKTIAESRDSMRVLFQHGHDPDIGDKPIAAITDLREDDNGAYYEADLFEGLPPLVMSGLRAGQYGASFRFNVVREDFDHDPGQSDHNPDGLPERTVREARVAEFGPVTFPAYPSATAGVRSLTDRFLLDRLAASPEKLEQLIAERNARLAADQAATDSTAPSGEPSGEQERREEAPDPTPATATSSTARPYPLNQPAGPPSWQL